jgi:hypothetical protein
MRNGLELQVQVVRQVSAKVEFNLELLLLQKQAMDVLE